MIRVIKMTSLKKMETFFWLMTIRFGNMQFHFTSNHPFSSTIYPPLGDSKCVMRDYESVLCTLHKEGMHYNEFFAL